MATYYVAVNGQHTGPYTIDQLAQLNLQPDSLVWNDTMPNWAPAATIAELQCLFAPQQPTYQQPAYQQHYQQHYQQGYQQGYQEYGQPSGGQQQMVGLVDALKLFFNKYADFTGRASRSEYWFANLGISLCFIAICILGVIFYAATGSTVVAGFFIVIGVLLGLAIFVPSLALCWRRLHDTGRSGLWYLITLVPYIGGIIFFVFSVLPSQPYENEYGPVPNVY